MSKNSRLITIAVIAVIVTGIADVILIASGKEAADVIGGTWVEYWAALATIWNLVIIAFAKFAAERGLEKPADYYQESDD